MRRNWDSIMFDNIGRKIQIVAKVTAWVDIAFSFLSGIGMIIMAISDFGDYWYLFFLSPLPVIIGCIAAWLSVITLYAFGKLVEDVEVIRDNSTTITGILSRKNPPAAPTHPENTATTTGENPANTATTAGWKPANQKQKEPAVQEASDNAPVENVIGESAWICGNCKRKNLITREDCWCCGNKR